MRRRDFIKGIAGSATAWPLAARAQRPERKRRVAVLMGRLSLGDPGGRAEAGALEEGLTELGWKLGGNIDLDYRWPGAELNQLSVAANEIVAIRPDVVVSRSTPATATIRNRGVPIIFVLVTDPKGSGFVQDLGRPGDALTGFSIFEASVGGKWLGLLKEAAPAVTHVSILFNPETAPFADGYLHSAQAVAPTLGATIVSVAPPTSRPHSRRGRPKVVEESSALLIPSLPSIAISLSRLRRGIGFQQFMAIGFLSH